MARSNVSPNAAGTIVDKLKPYEGGTGQTTAAAALAALGGIPLTAINQPLGIVGLDGNKKIPADALPVDLISVIGVQGAADIVKGTSSVFKITNFDAFNTYEVLAIGGNAVIVGDTIVYTAPLTLGAGGFTLNGRTYNLQVVDFKPLKPTLSVVDVVGPDTITAILQAAGGPFDTGGGTATHASSDWQMSSDAAFSNIIQQSLTNTSTKTSWTTNAVALNTTRYLRVRYRDSTGAVGDWSDTFTITTRSSFVPGREEMKLSPLDRQALDQFGRGLAISGDGSRVFASSMNGNTNKKGAVYVYIRNDTSWTLEAKVPAASIDGDSSYQGLERGMYLGTDTTGSRFAVSTVYSTKVMVYVRNGVTWTLETEIAAPGGNRQLSVDLSKDSLRLVIGESRALRAYVYLRTGSAWALESTLDPADAQSQGFGYQVAFDETATRVAVSAVFATSASTSATSAGAVFVYLRTNTAWTKETKLLADVGDQTVNAYFGSDVKLSSAGDVLAIGCSNGNTTANNSGCFYVFRRSGTAWTKEARKYPPVIATGYVLGYSLSINGVGNLIAVSTPMQGIGGYVHLFSRTSSIWDLVASINSSDIGSNDQYGNEVRLAANSSRMVVSAHGSDSGGVVDSGGVYVYS